MKQQLDREKELGQRELRQGKRERNPFGQKEEWPPLTGQRKTEQQLEQPWWLPQTRQQKMGQLPEQTWWLL